MPPPRALNKGDRAYCLLCDCGRFHYEIAFRGHAAEDANSVTQIGVEWLSDPDEDRWDELWLVEMKVVKRLRRKPQKAKVEIT